MGSKEQADSCGRRPKFLLQGNQHDITNSNLSTEEIFWAAIGIWNFMISEMCCVCNADDVNSESHWCDDDDVMCAHAAKVEKEF